MGKALVIHLSDLHIRTDKDPILDRASHIADAVRNFDYSVDAAIVVVSGDLAYSGSNAQYEVDWKFLHQIVSLLESDLAGVQITSPKPVSVFAIPGNHDCNFSEADGLRLLAINGVIADASKAKNSSIVDACLGVQQPFFEALAANGTYGIGAAATTEYDQQLSYEYTIPVGDKMVRLLCLNTAWLSTLHEDQGHLYLPDDAIAARDSEDALTIAMFHHPYKWMEADAARCFQKRIEAEADLILTGHEHDSTRRTQAVSTGERNEYVEGGALQDKNNPKQSVFNAFVLDIGERKQKAAKFNWDGTRYVSAEATEEFAHEWSDLPITSRAAGSSFDISKSMQSILDDLGATLTHRNRGMLSLPDVFVFPDLAEIPYSSDRTNRLVPGPDVVSLMKSSPWVLMLGDSNAGKTCLARMLFRTLHRDGYVPILVDASAKLPTGDRLHGYLERLFGDQYDPSKRDAYRQLERDRRVIIVDDFHLLPARAEYRRSFIDALTQASAKVVLLANDLITEASSLFDPRSRSDGSNRFATFRILPFGHVRRNALVEKWLLLGDASEMSDVQFAHDREVLTSTLTALMGKNLIPPYPVYVLAILQGAEAMTPWDSSVSTYGAYYELLIRNALAQGRTPVQSDIILNYLAHFAHWLFSHQLHRVDIKQFREVHNAFEQRFDIDVPLKDMRLDMARRHIFTISNDVTQFKYRYIYYYFVARWLRDHMAEAETRATVTSLSQTLHIDDQANILLFLAHLSKDPVIVGAMLHAARRFYSDAPEITFKGDVNFLAELADNHGQLAYTDRDANENRNQVLATLDEHESQSDGTIDGLKSEDRSVGGILDPVATLNAATKTLQILGQLVRNFPGSLEGGVKLDIARECYSLGLRALGFLYATLRDSEGPILRFAAESIRGDYPKLTEKEVEIRARYVLGMTAELLGIMMVDLISSAVGSPDLEQTYDKLEKMVDTPAIKLINASVHLNQSMVFPEGEVRKLAKEWASHPFPRTLLSYLVLMRFHMFPVANSTKRSVCAALRIQYTPRIDANPLRKLVAYS